MPVLQKFCCCGSLESGGIILGSFGLAGGIIMLIVAIMLPFLIPKTELEDPDLFKILIIVYSVGLSLIVLQLIISSLLIVGTVKRNHLLLLPWLIVTFIFLALNGISTIGGIVSSLVNNRTSSIYIFTFIGIPIFCTGIYFWICILSLYGNLKIVSHRYKDRVSAPPDYNGFMRSQA